MIIRKERIVNVKKHLEGIPNGTELRLISEVTGEAPSKLIKIGLSANPVVTLHTPCQDRIRGRCTFFV